MQAEYRKEWMDTYLWVLAENPEKQDYVEKMLLYNPGEGRLEFSKQQENGQEYYCYKITGKKALHGIYIMMSIGERQIKNILEQIFETLEKGREYLLREDDFVLQPNYMFATLPKMEIELCYVPGYGVPLKDQLEGFFEYLLNRVDYDDKNAVELLYDCYMLCVREQGGLKEIRERIQAEKTPEESLIQETEPEEPEEKETVLRPEEKKITEGSSSYVSWLADRFLGRKKKEALMVAEEREAYHAGRNQERPAKKEEPEPAPELMERTVLLSMPKTEGTPYLTNEKTGEVIWLKKMPFYIGSVDKYADYILKEEGVSRIHCCISKRGDTYYLADLNSTNGTYLDSREVFPGKEEMLSAGSCITVAKTEFCVNLPCH